VNERQVSVKELERTNFVTRCANRNLHAAISDQLMDFVISDGFIEDPYC